MNLSLFPLISLLCTVYAVDEYFQKIAPRKSSPYNLNYNAVPSLKPFHVPRESFEENFDINPDSKIVYNFELIQRYQPSHSVNVVEDIANYLRPKVDTRTSLFRVSDRKIPETVAVNKNHVNNFTPIESRISIPDAPTLRCSMLASQVYSENENYGFHESSLEQRGRRITTTTQPTTTQGLNLVFDTKDATNEHLSWTPEVFERNVFQDEEFGRKPYNQGTPTGTVSTAKKPGYRHSLANRGKHKFNYNDLVTTDVPRPTTENVLYPSTLGNHKTPPPVPTLSPWYDGFGK
ncbi:hypothetical protein EVAR_81318_1 [Eumeta japonica]|uniref:Uncharacterized protein n=1 Tax=Eumeta variegata TaxID=151549 RepID=A0A4C1W014_EUMVA|nr:hypothetical protein EVAR_81318_1 [Eumeta japonica]